MQVEQVVARLQELQCSISGFKPATPSKLISSSRRSVVSICLVIYCLRSRSGQFDLSAVLTGLRNFLSAQDARPSGLLPEQKRQF